MKSKIVHILSAMALGVSLMAITDVASAGCWYQRGYWSGGYYHPGHRVCSGGYYMKRCGWVPGFRDRHGYWHRGYRAC